MEKLKRDLEHIKKDGIDSGALFRRVRKYLKELAEYKETGLTQAELLLFKTVKDIALDTPAIRLVDILFAEQAGRLVVLPCRKYAGIVFHETRRQLFPGWWILPSRHCSLHSVA